MNNITVLLHKEWLQAYSPVMNGRRPAAPRTRGRVEELAG